MKAALIRAFGNNDQIEIAEIESPIPEANEVLIETHYAGVNPVDWKLREGWLKKRLPHQFPLILGWDVAGTIVKLGKNVTHFKEGDSVFAYCRKPTVQWGTFAEFVAVDAASVAKIPPSIQFKEAAVLPLVALTAWQALFDTAHLKEGQTVLIHAAAGGVGSIATQLAKWKKAKIYATASERNHSYVKSLGADICIDYTKNDFEKEMKSFEPNGVDVVLDCVGETVFEKSLNLIRKDGWIVSIVRLGINGDIGKAHHCHAGYVFVEPNGKELQEIADLIEKSHLRPPHITEYPLKEVKRALDFVYKGHTRGKVVLRIK